MPGWWTLMYLLARARSRWPSPTSAGLSSYKGQLGYSSANEAAQQQAKMAEAVRPIYARFETSDAPQIAADPGAREIGQRLFLNTCSAGAAGSTGGDPAFPTRRHGLAACSGSPEAIMQTITNGCIGVMPPWKAAIDPKTAGDIAQYVRSLSD
ncbi:hypothetical protein WJ973_12310 [Achromobacter xylosoxidans]